MMNNTCELLSKFNGIVDKKFSRQQFITIFEWVSRLKAEGVYTFDNIFGFKKTESNELQAIMESKGYKCILDEYIFE